MGWLIIVGSIPIVVLGYFGRDIITNDLRSLWLIATVMIVFGIILGIADKYGKSERSLSQLNTKHGFSMVLHRHWPWFQVSHALGQRLQWAGSWDIPGTPRFVTPSYLQYLQFLEVVCIN
jgi:hypothetical protein